MSQDVLIPMLIALAMPLAGQMPLREASNTPIPTNPFPAPEAFEGRGAVGTVSVQELERPVEGKARRLLEDATRSIANGDVARGLELARAAARYPGAEGHALGILATEHLKAGSIDVAIEEYQRATVVLPGNAVLHSNLAYALGARSRYEEALKEARLALKLDPARVKVRLVLGMLLLETGARDEARFHLKKAAELPAARVLLAREFGE